MPVTAQTRIVVIRLRSDWNMMYDIAGLVGGLQLSNRAFVCVLLVMRDVFSIGAAA